MELETPGRAAGGKARAAAMTPEERAESARKASQARWGAAPVPAVMHGSPEHPLRIAGVEIECYVLADETRVITQASMLQSLGRHRRVAGPEDADDERIPPILRGKAIRNFIPDSLIEEATPITFRLANGSRASGYRAEALPAVCEVYLAAREAGALPQNQQRIAAAAEVLVRGLARVGIIALVDEATGFQDIRTRDALSRILEAFIAKELQPWVSTFPPDFYREMFRLRNLEYKAESMQTPRYFGHLTNDVVYDRLAPGVLMELRRLRKRGSSGKPTTKLFQGLTDNFGYPKLREHLGSVVTLMKLSEGWPDFMNKLNVIHPKTNMPPAMWSDDDTLQSRLD